MGNCYYKMGISIRQPSTSTGLLRFIKKSHQIFFQSVFSLALAYFKLKQLEKADDALNKGIDIARRSDDAIYLSKFHF
ncbi:hypothetical protein PO124_32345 [Bacillus licheniformis]|nr:hypothetical protein [Bacillus licheniformis]